MVITVWLAGSEATAMASTSLAEQKTRFVGPQVWSAGVLCRAVSVKYLLLSLTVCVVLFHYQLQQFYRNYGGKGSLLHSVLHLDHMRVLL